MTAWPAYDFYAAITYPVYKCCSFVGMVIMPREQELPGMPHRAQYQTSEQALWPVLIF